MSSISIDVKPLNSNSYLHDYCFFFFSFSPQSFLNQNILSYKILTEFIILQMSDIFWFRWSKTHFLIPLVGRGEGGGEQKFAWIRKFLFYKKYLQCPYYYREVISIFWFRGLRLFLDPLGGKEIKKLFESNNSFSKKHFQQLYYFKEVSLLSDSGVLS